MRDWQPLGVSWSKLGTVGLFGALGEHDILKIRWALILETRLNCGDTKMLDFALRFTSLGFRFRTFS